jgi:hypothetical protein
MEKYCLSAHFPENGYLCLILALYNNGYLIREAIGPASAGLVPNSNGLRSKPLPRFSGL